jgi:hypothetical protein
MSGIDSLQNGLWVPPGAPYCAQVSGQASANQARVVRFVCPRSMTITKMAFFVNTAASVDDSCDVGIYDAAGATINRLGSSGSVSGQLTTTGQKTITLTAGVALSQNQVYYAAFAYGAVGGTGAYFQVSPLNTNLILFTMFGTGSPQLEAGTVNSSFPLPTALVPTGYYAPLIMALIQ